MPTDGLTPCSIRAARKPIAALTRLGVSRVARRRTGPALGRRRKLDRPVRSPAKWSGRSTAQRHRLAAPWPRPQHPSQRTRWPAQIPIPALPWPTFSTDLDPVAIEEGHGIDPHGGWIPARPCPDFIDSMPRPWACRSFRRTAHGKDGSSPPSQPASGVGLIDFDSDGWLDVYLVQGGPFPPGAKGVGRPSDRLPCRVTRRGWHLRGR